MKVPAFLQAIPIATAAITWATSIASTTARSRKSSTGRPSAIPSSCMANGFWTAERCRRGALARIAAEARTEMEAAVEFAVEAPYPSADQVDEDVYA